MLSRYLVSEFTLSVLSLDGMGMVNFYLEPAGRYTFFIGLPGSLAAFSQQGRRSLPHGILYLSTVADTPSSSSKYLQTVFTGDNTL
jgi:hypothetical protein